jgi:alginate O-acetyltransferase complex protein AlgI
MLFSSLIFLLIFLPAFLLVYTCVPGCRWKNLVLLLFSLLFYAWGEPVYVLLMMGSILVNFLIGRLMGSAGAPGQRENRRKVWLIVGITANLVLLCIMKYMDLLIRGVNLIFGSELALLHIALPIGISFYTFQTMSYLVDVYRGTVQCEKNLIDFGAYVSMFPQLIAGPIVRYETVQKELVERRVDASGVSEGIVRFCIGLSKKILIANQVGAVYEQISALTGVQPMALSWLGALSYTLQIYFDFAGYSDMAIGLGLMMGFHFPENFEHPYRARSITEFWRRWHISLSTWFREYVYIPLGGNRVSVGRHIRNLLIVWGLTGLWHGAEPNFLLWGLYYGVLLILEKYVYGGALRRCPALVQHIYTLLLVIFGWVLFSNTTMTALIETLKGLVGIGGVGSTYAWYLLRTHWVLYLAAILLSVGVVPALWNRISKNTTIREQAAPVSRIVFVALALVACVAVLLRGSYNPFLYFRF